MVVTRKKKNELTIESDEMNGKAIEFIEAEYNKTMGTLSILYHVTLIDSVNRGRVGCLYNIATVAELY